MDTVQSYLHACPARTVLEAITNKWTVLVLTSLRSNGGTMRFNELRRFLDGITQKMLTQTLRSLERDGMVRRTVYPTVPPRVDYSVTELGTSLGELFNTFGEWANENVDRIMAARTEFDTRPAPEPVN
ncbi:HxlR family transcriptional regulator [Herbihabitans rhizosphaerae]|uniref:HxlR family transcriptional regulator n=1 Tax=Herbihabitans rhizosphaerae TaxID=1872711 RepID=A0A4Q7KLH4_9PSEU|nr:helix-turn-helix domain-containing protein [Herbihabitans rhizosphaerae]RZS37094.1 HxlR family transcriptional regulator [Herbihabitans rhizosphaerae]